MLATVSDAWKNECHVGQPFCGYALRQQGTDQAVVIGVLIQKELFYRDFLPILASAPSIFDFFLEPRSNQYSTDFLRASFPEGSPVRTLLEMMVIEYADRQVETQTLLKSLTSSLLLHVARRCRELAPQKRASRFPKKS